MRDGGPQSLLLQPPTSTPPVSFSFLQRSWLGKRGRSSHRYVPEIPNRKHKTNLLLSSKTTRKVRVRQSRQKCLPAQHFYRHCSRYRPSMLTKRNHPGVSARGHECAISTSWFNREVTRLGCLCSYEVLQIAQVVKPFRHYCISQRLFFLCNRKSINTGWKAALKNLELENCVHTTCL